MQNNKIYLVLYSQANKRYYTKYFKSEHEKEKYKRRVKYMNLTIIEDSSDIFYND